MARAEQMIGNRQSTDASADNYGRDSHAPTRMLAVFHGRSPRP